MAGSVTDPNPLLPPFNGQKLERVLRKIAFGDESYENPGEISDAENANAISSDIVGFPEYHLPVIDIDFPVYALPSSTEGHSHLYIDVPMHETTFFKLLDALVDIGLVEEGYAEGAKRRGHSDLRRPWIKKGGS
jgi:hypothetical protein